MTSKQIGWLNVPAQDYTNSGYECAAWWTEMHIPAQRVPLMFDGYWLLASAEGTIKADSFQSLYCGQRIGKAYDTTQNAGKPASRRYQMNEYHIEALVASGQVDLLPSWCINRTTFWHQWGRAGYRRWHARLAQVFALPVYNA